MEEALKLFLSVDEGKLDARTLPSWDVVEEALLRHPTMNCSLLLSTLAGHDVHRQFFFDSYSWEVFDIVFSLSMIPSVDMEGALERLIVAIFTNVRPKELEIMCFERFHGETESLGSFRLICFVFQCLTVVCDVDQQPRLFEKGVCFIDRLFTFWTIVFISFLSITACVVKGFGNVRSQYSR
jgi:hypothetical protein